MTAAVAALVAVLDQLAGFIETLTDDQYTHPPGPDLSPIGGHVRHNLDHVAALLAGVHAGRLDYDRRDRDNPVGHSREAALAAIRWLRGELLAVPWEAAPDWLRLTALPARRWRVGPRLAVLPVDPPSGGTWLAANDAGLVLALLNVTPPDPRPASASRSRGEVIPALLGCDSPANAVGAVTEVLNYPDFAPFRLVLVGSGVAADVRWDGSQALVVNRLLGGGPLLYTSSGLGDHLVEGVRRAAFDAAFAGPPAGWAAAQDRFHRQPLPGRGHLGVNTARADARTVSHAVVTVGDAGVEYTYHPDAPDRPAERVTLCMPAAARVA